MAGNSNWPPRSSIWDLRPPQNTSSSVPPNSLRSAFTPSLASVPENSAQSSSHPAPKNPFAANPFILSSGNTSSTQAAKQSDKKKGKKTSSGKEQSEAPAPDTDRQTPPPGNDDVPEHPKHPIPGLQIIYNYNAGTNSASLTAVGGGEDLVFSNERFLGIVLAREEFEDLLRAARRARKPEPMDWEPVEYRLQDGDKAFKDAQGVRF